MAEGGDHAARRKRGSRRGRRPAPAEVLPAGGPDLVGVVDVGSRALRLAVEEIHPGGSRRLESLSAPVAIGIDTFSAGRISAVTTEAVLRTLRDFSSVLGAYRIDPADCRAVATTAVRDARNREVFLDRVASNTGFRIAVIEAIEETRLVHQLVRERIGPRFDEGRTMLLALGAGGTQVIVQRDGEILLAESRRFGMLKLMGGASERPALARAQRKLRKVVSSIDRLQPLTDVSTVVVVNSELHRLAVGMARCRRMPYGLEIRRQSFERWAAAVEEAATERIAEASELDHAAAELARMAFVELRAFCAATSVQQLIIPRCTMLDSLVLDVRASRASEGEEAAGGDAAAPSAGDPPPTLVESGAWAVARKYQIDAAHAAQVRRLALQLFDGLRRLTGLDGRSRLLLGVAAILHDVGSFVSAHEHEVHSAYLVRASELLGLSGSEVDRVAAMVRHHRRPFRDIESRDLGPLSAAERVEVLKLTALLRVADALDADHLQRVARVRLRATAEQLHVLAETRTGDREAFVDLEAAFERKADLCEEVFGMRPQLTEVLGT